MESKSRVDIIPERFCQCSQVCSQIICSDLWSDGSRTKNTDTNVYLDPEGGIRIHVNDSLLNSFETDCDYDEFIDHIYLAVIDMVTSLKVIDTDEINL